MADQEIINVLLRLENPQVLDRVERLKSEQFQIKFSGSLDQGIKDILAIKDKKISITADVQGAINSLKQVETSLKSLQGLQEIKINLSGNVEKDLDRIGKKALELQAKLYAAELNQLGLVQNYNPKTFSGGDKEIRQAQILRGINEQTVVANKRAPITQQQLDAAKTSQPVQELVNEVTTPYNPGQIRRTQQAGELPDEKAVKRAIQARQEDILKAAEQQVIADFNSIANDLIKDISKPASGASSVRGQGVSDKFRLGQLAEDAALERQARESNAARELANQELNEQRIKQNFLKETGVNLGVRVPLSQVGAVTREDSQNDFERAQELAKTQIREESLAKLRANLHKDNSTFARDLRPGITALNSKYNNAQAQEEAKEEARKQQALASSLAKRAASKKELGGLLTELGLGLVSGGGGGFARTSASLLGGLTGAAFGPGGAILGSQIGGALGEGTAKSLEAVAGALENVSNAGLEFQKTIVAISGVLQANTRVIGEDGKQLGAVETSQFNTNRAREIQKAARSELLPLGIGGESEAQLVGGLISGFSQRGIILSPEETKVVSRRFGSAIVGLAPQLIGNSVQLRRDSEDIAAGSPNAGRTTLGVALKNIAPDLFRTLATGQDVVKATERLEQFNNAIKNSDQASVQVLRLSGAIDKLRTTAGDSFLQGLAPGLKSLADIFSEDSLSEGFDGLFKQIGSLGTVLINLGILVGKTVSEIASSIPILGPLIENLKNFVQQAAAGPTGTSIPNPEDVIKKYLTELGVESKGVDKDATTNANFRLEKLNNAKEKAFLSGPEFQERFLGDILNEQLKALDVRSSELSGTANSETFAGQKKLAQFQGNIARQKSDFAQEGFEFYSKAAEEANDPAKAAIFEGKAKKFKEDLDSAQKRFDLFSDEIKNTKDPARAAQLQRFADSAKGDLDKAQSGYDFYSKAAGDANNPAQAGIFQAVADNFKIKQDTAGVDVKKADAGETKAALNETKALEGLRNAQEGLIKVQLEQVLQTNNLNRSLQEANDSVTTFASKVQQAFASEEENIIQASLEAQKLGVETPFSFTEDDLLNAKRNSAGARLNGLLDDAGLRGTRSGTNESTGVNLPRTGTPFTNRLDAEAGKIADSIASITNELEILPRVLRDAIENLTDLTERTKLQFEDGKIPDFTSSNNGILRLGFGDAVGAGTPYSQEPVNPKLFGEAPTPQDRLLMGMFKQQKATDPFLRMPGMDMGGDIYSTTLGGVSGRQGGPEGVKIHSKDLINNPYDTDVYDKGDRWESYGKDPRFEPFNNHVAFDAQKEYGYPSGGPVYGYQMQGYESTDNDTRSKLEKLGIKNINKDSLPYYTDVLDKQMTGFLTDAFRPNMEGPNGDLLDPEEFARKNSLFDISVPELKAKTKKLGAPSRPPTPQDLFSDAPLFEDMKKEVLGQIVSPVHDNPINFSDSLIARPSLPSRAYNPILREGLNEGLGNKADAKTNAVLEDVVGGFLDADVDGLKKQNRAPASGLKNGLFSGGLFGDREDVKSGKGTAESNFADSVGAKIDENFNKLGDIITKALGSAL